MSDKLKVGAVKCPKCGDIIYSRARHDFHYCSCGSVAVDGGRDYMKVCWRDAMPERLILELDVTQDQLFWDWNNGGDKYGLIKNTVDKNLKPSNTQNMTKTFAELIQAALQAVRNVSVNGFSAHQVTRQARQMVNSGNVVLSDRVKDNVDGVDTFPIGHNEVKGEIESTYKSLGLKRQHNGQFFVYVEDDTDAVQVDTDSTPVGVPATVLPPTQVTPTQGFPEPQKLVSYVTKFKNDLGYLPTLKQIQARFKEYHFTCKQYEGFCIAAGLIVKQNGPYVSQWAVA